MLGRQRHKYNTPIKFKENNQLTSSITQENNTVLHLSISSYAFINKQPGSNKLLSHTVSCWVISAQYFNEIAYIWDEHSSSNGTRLP